MEHVVEQVLATVRKRLDVPYTLDDLAAMAMFSKFHFARMFRRTTGVSPRRFLYALRMDEAKRQLLTTELSVAEVSHQVGYLSVGTFTSRFTTSVGVSPAEYRRLRGNVLPALRGNVDDCAAPCAIAVSIERADVRVGEAPTAVGLFRRLPPEGLPIRWGVVAWPRNDWTFRNVPIGRWCVLAVTAQPADNSGLSRPHPLMISLVGPVQVCPETPNAHVTVRLHPMRPVDPPILVPLAGLAAASA
jgi:AraC family transcriptional regulator